MDAIFLAIDGQTKGPYTLVQVRQFLARGEATRATPAWYNGIADWTALGPILDTVADDEAATVPAPPPPPAPIPGEFTTPELRHICKSQNLLMVAVLAGFATFFIIKIPVVGLFLVLGVAAFEIYALFQLGTALRMSPTVVALLCLCMFIPFVSLVILVVVSGRASKLLKARGVRIGLMGGNAGDIRD
jgi:hypothetical protein